MAGKGPGVTDGGQCCLDFRGMMPVIINNCHTTGLALDFKTPLYPGKGGKSGGNPGKRDLQFHPHRQCRQTVQHIVPSRKGKGHLTQYLAALTDLVTCG